MKGEEPGVREIRDGDVLVISERICKIEPPGLPKRLVLGCENKSRDKKD